MSTQKRTKEPATKQALTLADVVIVWHDGKKEHLIEGEHVALALALVYRQISNGMGDWKTFTDPNMAISRLQGVEQILSNAAEVGTGLVDDEWYWTVNELVQGARICTELSARPVNAAEYRIEVGKVERLSRMVITKPAKAVEGGSR